jgi:hypothetical protein
MHRISFPSIGLLLAALYVPAARAQVWLDASQLNGKLPEWVDQRYLHPPDTTPDPSCQRLWVEPVYRTVCKRIWHDAVYETRCERVWVEGHYETHVVTTYDDCGCPRRCEQRVWVPGHYTTEPRQVCVRPGYWETIESRECVTPGHWTLSDLVKYQVR